MWIEGGEDVYLRSLRKYTGHKETTVKEVHEIGLSEIERLKKEFFEIGKDVFDGVNSPEEVLYKMQTEPSMRYESKEQMLQLAEDTIERAYKPLQSGLLYFLKLLVKFCQYRLNQKNMHLQLIIFHLCQMDLEMVLIS